MVYLSTLILPDAAEEGHVLLSERRTCFNSIYPFRIFPEKGLETVDFDAITIFYGGNGSGKTTLLNIIAQKLGAIRHSEFNNSPYFQKYTNVCEIQGKLIPDNCQMLSSDDVFDYMINIRYLNEGIDNHREQLFAEYSTMHQRASESRKYRQLQGLDDYDRWKEVASALSSSQSRFVKERLTRNVDMFSNGQTSMRYFTEHIDQNTVYLLDEPENSLSIEHQLLLAQYIYDSARHFKCQFILATHSPVFLALEGAKIYDLDSDPVCTKPWTQLANVRKYFDFFYAHKAAFLQEGTCN